MKKKSAARSLAFTVGGLVTMVAALVVAPPAVSGQSGFGDCPFDGCGFSDECKPGCTGCLRAAGVCV